MLVGSWERTLQSASLDAIPEVEEGQQQNQQVFGGIRNHRAASSQAELRKAARPQRTKGCWMHLIHGSKGALWLSHLSEPLG